MTESIKELEQQLAERKALEAKNNPKKEFDLVVYVDAENLEAQNLELKKFSEKDKAKFLKGVGDLGQNFESIKVLSDKLDEGRVGDWLELLEYLESPMGAILGVAFDVEPEKIASFPNIDVLAEVINQNEWAGTKSQKLATELSYIGLKASEQQENTSN